MYVMIPERIRSYSKPRENIAMMATLFAVGIWSLHTDGIG